MDRASSVVIEYLRPKTVPNGLVALAIVSQILDDHIKVRISGGIILTVDAIDISRPYSECLGQKKKEPPKLSQLFKKGQSVVCKIKDRRPKKGSPFAQEIFATLDPAELFDEVIPATLLSIPNVPIQGAIKSIEDYGYRVDIGFSNIMGFLNFEEAEEYCKQHNKGRRFCVGQIVRCCLRKAKKDSRVVQLSMREELLKLAEFSQEKSTDYVFTERCILPGSTAWGTIMKVRKNGLVVLLMNEFTAFVTLDQFQAEGKKYKISDKVKCIVLYCNHTTNNFALSLKDEEDEELRDTFMSKRKNQEDDEVVKKSRLERSKEAKQREEKIREAEKKLLDPNRAAQSIPDFERLVLGHPNTGDVWIKYSKFFLDNIETEKARIICRRALKTINFRLDKEKLKVWFHLFVIEAKYGGRDRLRSVIEEAMKTNNPAEVCKRGSRVLKSCGELDIAQELREKSLKLEPQMPDVWIDYIRFIMERKDFNQARALFERACKTLIQPSNVVYLRSRFAHLEFQLGDVERGKTMFENLLAENPKRRDLKKVYEAALTKYGGGTGEIRRDDDDNDDHDDGDDDDGSDGDSGVK